jgi:uncharacterized protein (UPF0371 family)
MGTCLSQVYHEHQRGLSAGYAKFETFPVWNLPIDHPVNLAYEAATADLGDVNMVDPYHLEARQQVVTNYNRDIEVFPVVRRICARIMPPEKLYVSPTDMGVNRIGFAITDDNVVREAATQEVIRRYFREMCNVVAGTAENSVPERVRSLMSSLSVTETDRRVVPAARKAAKDAERGKGKGNDGVFCGAALELRDGTIVTGKNSPLLHAATSCIINAIKHMAQLPDQLKLISPEVIDSIGVLKRETFREKNLSLSLSDALTALSVSAPANPSSALALAQLGSLKDCEMHISHLPSPNDEVALRKLGIRVTSDPVFPNRNLFME